MTAIRLNILGAGRAARVVARWLAATGSVGIGQVANRHLESAHGAVEFIGSGEVVETISGLQRGDWLLVGLTDRELQSACPGTIEGRPDLAFHLSGCLDSSCLQGWAPRVASTHPARAFDRSGRASEQMPGTWVTAEGDEEALEWLQPLFTEAGAVWRTIERSQKPLYHGAAVVASNYLVTLTALARDLAQAAGFEASDAAGLLSELSGGALGTLERTEAAQALTGPVERGDLDQICRVHEAMIEARPEAASLLSELGLATLRLARQARGKGSADDAIEAVFTRP